MQKGEAMRLVVKQSGHTIKELRFDKGPIYIGRHLNSQVLLPDRAVSRQHAVIFNTHDKKWVVEDLDSSNKTYLNDEEIHKSEIKTGDYIRIIDFVIEIDIDKKADNNNNDNTPAKTKENKSAVIQSGMEDTLITTSYEPKITIRTLDAEYAPAVKFSTRRIKDFVQATEAICKENGLDEVVQTLLHIASRQFNAYHAWCALRNQSSGPMTCHAGKRRDGQIVQLSEIKLNDKITEAIEKKQFVLMTRVNIKAKKEEEIQSAMIVPITGQNGCFGVLYIDNAKDHEKYTLADLDYLMLLAIHTAGILENF
ncbi:MAG: FHA domain-containing protein [Planctomycetes bacterium]|nr:FHA domain-containing protein [Planctomycetota bacterium]